MQRRLPGCWPSASCYGGKRASPFENLPFVTCSKPLIADHHDIYVTIVRINYMSVTTIPGKANPVCGNRMVEQIETKKGLPKPGGFYT
ncbi:MAG TPA: hypothetical protein DCM48_19570 [Thalassospira sp.]|nr:hypothetical protein [Thalassospira sp.]